MPKCRNCGEEITKFDKDICPYCGFKEPYDIDEYKTRDVTQTIDMIKDENNHIDFIIHKKIIAFVFCLLLGFFSIDLVYLGYKKLAIVRTIINFVISSILFLFIFFLTELGFYSLLIAIGIPVSIYFFYSFSYLLRRGIRDSNGVYIK